MAGPSPENEDAVRWSCPCSPAGRASVPAARSPRRAVERCPAQDAHTSRSIPSPCVDDHAIAGDLRNCQPFGILPPPRVWL